jgi:peptidyl-prolyl cis-trans isomerase A (cyclophilin A)
MAPLIAAIWNRLRPTPSSRRPRAVVALRARPSVELLEDRTAPSVSATGVLSGQVLVGGSTSGFVGADVTLTGSSTTGRSINVSTTTDANGAFSFTQLLPGTYGLSEHTPSGFLPGGPTSLSGIKLAEGQTITQLNLGVGGLAPSKVSLAFFLASSAQPTPGSGSTVGFSLDSANPLTNQTLSAGSTTFLDLSGNFLDPDTANGTVVAFNTSQGTINVTLFDRDAPQTVTNFLANLQAGDYNSDLFQRLSNLSQTTLVTGSPPMPFQVLQGGGFTVNLDNSGNVASFTPLTGFQPIQNESNDALHPNALGTLAMARTSAVNSATSQFFFNLTDNKQELAGNPGAGFAVFGSVSPTDGQSLSNLANYVKNYTPNGVSNSLFALPLLNGFTPGSNFPAGTPPADLALVNGVSVVKQPTGQLTYTILSNSNPSVVTATLGANIPASTFSANQLQLVAKGTGSAVITIQITDIKGEVVTKQFTVTV